MIVEPTTTAHTNRTLVPPLWDLLSPLVGFLTGASDRESVQRDAVFAFLVRCLSAALLYASQIAMARWMGSNEYGIYVFVWTCVLLIGGMSHLGMNLGIIRLIAIQREAGDFERLRGLINGGRILALANGTLAALAGWVVVNLFGTHIAPAYRDAALLALVCVPLYAMTDIQDGIGRGNGWIGTALVPPYVLRPLLLLAVMSAAWALGASMQASTAAMAAIAATWTTALVQAALINRRADVAFGPGPARYEPRLWITTSLPLLAISGCEILLQNTDVLVLSRFTQPADVAVYFAAGKTMSLVMFIHYAVGSAMANRFAILKARGDEAALRDAVRNAVRWTFWPSLLAAAVILALGRPLLSLFGPAFVDGYRVMAILVVGFLARSAMGPSEFLLNMLGQQRRCAAVMMAAAALDIVLNLALVPPYGITGAALATAIALASAALLNARMARIHLGLNVAIWRNL